MNKKKIVMTLTTCTLALFFTFAPNSALSQNSIIEVYAGHKHDRILTDELAVVKNGWWYQVKFYECQNTGCNEPIIKKWRRTIRA